MPKTQPYDTKYRLTRIEELCKRSNASDEESKGLTLAIFKYREYWFRLLRRWPKEYPEYLDRIYLTNSGQISIMQEAVRWRLGQKKDPFRKTLWTVEEIQRRIDRKGSLNLALMDHFQQNIELRDLLRPAILKHAEKGIKFLAGKVPAVDDSLGGRLKEIKEALRLGDIDVELLLWSYLRKTNEGVELLHEITKVKNGRRRFGEFYGPNHSVLAVLIGCRRSHVENALGKDAPLLRLGLLDEDYDMPTEVSDFLEKGGAASILEKHFRIYRGPVLPLESHTVALEQRELLVELLRSHDGKRPFHVLLHGMEGTGKTEFSRSLGAASGRTVFEVGVSLKDALEERGTQYDSLIRYGLRALQMAAYQAEGQKCLLVVDEADTLLNCGEKGKLNQIMEKIQTPVIWISNDVRYVERSTLRRFDYSIVFRKLGETQRKLLWTRILEKHGASDLLPQSRMEEFARRYPTAAGGIELAVRNATALVAGGSSLPSERVMENVLRSHGKLLELRDESGEKSARSPSYSLEGLHIEGDVLDILHTANAFNRRWLEHNPDQGPCNLTALLYGPPGTGKTEFARHLARELKRPLLFKRASDLLGMFVGETEKKIRAAFEEAREDGAVLLLDEADSFLQSREGAHCSWEVTQVNELLTQMENFTGLLVCSTNFEGSLDAASRRRFHLKLEFGYLKGDGARHFWKVFFAGHVAGEPDGEFFRRLCALPLLAPGDFKAVYERLRYFPPEEVPPESVLEELRREIGFKDRRAGRSIGF